MTAKEFIKEISLEGEIWKDVVGYEGLYIVSNASRVASLPLGYKRGRVLKTSLTSHGYPCVCLRKDNVGRKIALHRIIAMAWIPNPNNYPCIDHIDGCRTNDSIENIRWVTHKMNMNNPITKDRIRVANTGNLNIGAKSRKPIVCMKDGQVLKTYPSIMSVKEDGLAPTTVRRHISKERIPDNGVEWVFLSDYENLKSAMSKNSM